MEAITSNVKYRVKIEAFEGPLDLLYQLIMKMEIDIYDIPIAKITKQYLLYLEEMIDMELENASEYLVVASKLLVLKSKRLLPYSVLEGNEELFYREEETDSLGELIDQLVKYRQFAEVTTVFRSLEESRTFFYDKCPSNLREFELMIVNDGVDEIISPQRLVLAFEKMWLRKELKSPLEKRVARQTISVFDRMKTVIDQLKNKDNVSFICLCEDETRETIVVTFLALLELLKKGMVSVKQNVHLGEIYLQLEVKEESEEL